MIMSNLIIYCMAVWRIASLLVSETGPFRIFERIRDRVGILHMEDGTPYLWPDGFFPEMLKCIWCTGLWVALAMFIFTEVSQYWAFRFAVTFAFSTGAIIIDALIKYLQGPK